MALKDTLMRATVGAAMLALSGGAALAADLPASGSAAPNTGIHAGAGAGGAGAGASVNTGGKLGAGANTDSGAAGANPTMGSDENAKGGTAGTADENAKSGAAANGAANTEMSAKPTTPPNSVVGKDVVNAKGEKIGEVSKISGDQIIVSSGGFLGIGTHDVAIPWSRFTMQGTGDKEKLEVSMTKDELKQMPEYKEPKASTGAAGNAGGAMGGGATTGTSK